MTDPILAIRDVAGDAIVAKLTANGYTYAANRVVVNPVQGQEPPYVVMGGETAIDFATKTSEGAEVTIACTAWGSTPTEAAQVADLVLQSLTDRSAPLAPSGFTVAGCYFDFRGSEIRDDQPTRTYWGIPIRVRLRVVEE